MTTWIFRCPETLINGAKLRGFTSRAREYGNTRLVNLHYIIHQEVLCSKVAKMESTFNQIDSIIIFILSSALNRRQFRALPSESVFDSADALCYTDVRWLSSGEAALRVFNLCAEIVAFYSSKNKHCVLAGTTFLISLAFLVNILNHVNTLNESLQGKAKSVCHLYRQVRQFSDKCQFLASHMSKHHFSSFPTDCSTYQRDGYCPWWHSNRWIFIVDWSLTTASGTSTRSRTLYVELRHQIRLKLKVWQANIKIRKRRQPALKIRCVPSETSCIGGGERPCAVWQHVFEVAFSHIEKHFEASIRLTVSQIYPNFSVLGRNCQEQPRH